MKNVECCGRSNAKIKGKKSARMKKVASDEKQYSLSKSFQKLVEQNAKSLIDQYREIASRPDDDIATIKDKEAKFKKIQESELNKQFNKLANVWLSTKFGNQVSEDDYYELRNHLSVQGSSDWTNFRSHFWFANAQDIAFERRFFNWELEFPEAFFGDEVGFDAVIGNPPYFSMERVTYLQPFVKVRYAEIYAGKLDISSYFLRIASDLIRNGGKVTYITARYFLESTFGAKLRDFLSKRFKISSIVDFGNYQVFDANVLTVIISLEMNDTISHESEVEV